MKESHERAPEITVGGSGLSRDEHEVTAAQTVANLRTALGRYPTDPGLLSLLRELRGNADFRRLWEEAPPTPWRSLTKTIDHPQLGPITLDCDTMYLPDADQAVIVYSAEAHSHAAEMLALLKVIGMQELNPQHVALYQAARVGAGGMLVTGACL